MWGKGKRAETKQTKRNKAKHVPREEKEEGRTKCEATKTPIQALIFVLSVSLFVQDDTRHHPLGRKNNKQLASQLSSLSSHPRTPATPFPFPSPNPHKTTRPITRSLTHSPPLPLCGGRLGLAGLGHPGPHHLSRDGRVPGGVGHLLFLFCFFLRCLCSLVYQRDGGEGRRVDG